MTDLDDNGSNDTGTLLGADGPFARELPNFAPRHRLLRLARAVQHAIAGRDTLIAAAPARRLPIWCRRCCRVSG
jgi:ATP-dependent DNA helicase DinG